MRNIKILLSLVLFNCCSCHDILAYDFEAQGLYFNIFDPEANSVEVTCKENTTYYDGDKYKGDIVIPETVDYQGNTYVVEKIGEWAFAYSVGMTSISIPKSIKGIGEDAFDYCID